MCVLYIASPAAFGAVQALGSVLLPVTAIS